MSNNNESDEKKRYFSFNDIVFANRNKEYGAFYLRRIYKKVASVSFLIAVCVIAAAVVTPVINAYMMKNKLTKKMEKNVHMEMEKVNDAPPPPPPPPPPEVEQQARFKAPVVVDTMKEEDIVPINMDFDNVKNEAPPEEITVAEVKDEVIEKEEEGLWIVEEQASFEGGDVNTFNTWVKQHTVYPQEATEAGISGKVYVQFSVNSKGEVCDVKIVRAVHPSLDKEAQRVVTSSPKWVAAKQGGKPVKQIFILPIVYQLQ